MAPEITSKDATQCNARRGNTERETEKGSKARTEKYVLYSSTLEHVVAEESPKRLKI